MRYKLLFLLLFMIPTVYGTIWVSDFNDCPDNYATLSCATPGELVCGYSGGDLQCNAPAEITAPATPFRLTTNTDVNDSFDGGWLIECVDYDSGDPYCDNEGAYWCDVNSTCWGTQQRYTNCTGFGASLCSDCRSGYANCSGILCNATIDSSDCSLITGGTGLNNNVDNASCGCNCDSGYLHCTALDTTGAAIDGCEDDIAGGGRDDCTGLGAYSDSNTWINDSCGCSCDTSYLSCAAMDTPGDPWTSGCNITTSGSLSCTTDGFGVSALNNRVNTSCGCQCDPGYGHCDGVSNPDDTAPETDGCEIQFGASGYMDELNGSINLNNNVNTACEGECNGGFQNCISENVSGDAYTGCNVQTGATDCSVWGGAWASSDNTNVNSTCGCECESGYLDCNATITDGCEIQESAACGNSTGTYAVGECAGLLGNCTADADQYDCDDDDGDGDILTCNNQTGNGCERLDGSACSVGSLVGNYDGPNCNCIVTKQNFQTGSQANYSTGSGVALLWGYDYGSGWKINMSDSNGNYFMVNYSGSPYSSDLISCGKVYTGSSGEFLCGSDASGGGGGFTGVDGIYIWNNSGVVTFNESKLNITIATVKVDNATYSDDSALLGGAAAATYLDDTTVANCSVNGSCANIAYDTEKIDNATHADTASDITGAVSNATYASDSALLGGAAAATYLDNVNTNCSVANSCSGIVYTAELANETIIRVGNTSWKVDNSTWADNSSGVNCAGIAGATSDLCTITSAADGIGFTVADNIYIYNNSGTVTFNESKLNLSVATVKVDNATYSSDSALLQGQNGAYYLDNANTNCSVADSCSGIVYTAELDNATIIRNNNYSWVDNGTLVRYTGNTNNVNLSSNNLTFSDDSCITWDGGGSLCYNGSRFRLKP